MTIPPKDQLTICFAHVAYQLQQQLDAPGPALRSFQVRSPDQLEARIGEADVLVVSGLWRDDLLDRRREAALHPVDQRRRRSVPQVPLLAERGIRLASAQGVNRAGGGGARHGADPGAE